MKGFAIAPALLLGVSMAQGRAIRASADPVKDEPAITAQEKSHWAFQPLPAPDSQTFDGQAEASALLDRLIDDKLARAGLKRSPAADAATLIRRVTFDLIGLPPSPEAVRGFIQAAQDPNARTAAYEALVDKLLASPAYGEHWAQFWLDLARYAETDGFEHDRERNRAWQYRDWVIGALNRDLPFDEFVRQQIAGDLLPNGEAAATGFLVSGPDMPDLNNQDERRHVLLNDITSTVGSVFLGLTVGCAQCHDHPYDPVSQADFYRLRAFFDNTVKPTRDKQLGPAVREFAEGVPASLVYVRGDFRRPGPLIHAGFPRIAARPQPAAVGIDRRAIRDESQPAAAGTDRRAIRDESQTAAGIDRRAIRDESQTAAAGIDRRAIRDESQTAAAGIDRRAIRDESQTAAAGIDRRAIRDESQTAAVGIDRRAIRDESQDNDGTNGLRARRSRPTPDQQTAAQERLDRIALAQWLTRPDNALFLRATANRIWQQHFGRALAPTPGDLGHQSPPPTHAELLDWLAAELPRQGWSLKRLHKVIVMSMTYQQATQAKGMPAGVVALYGCMPRKRMTGEMLRDAMLSVAGVLNAKAGGPGVRLPLPAEISGTLLQKQNDVTPDATEHLRRSIYAFARRNARHPLFDLFDRPDALMSCARRGESTTAPQALLLMNSEFAQCMAQALADRALQQAGPAPAGIVEFATWQCCSRAPTLQELDVGKRFLQSQAFHSPGLREAVADYCLALLNANEFIHID